MINVHEHFGNIDIYLFDQILKNRFHANMKILDAGCGGGRNLVYFLRNDFDVYGVDENSEAIENVRALAARLSPGLSLENFRQSEIGSMPFSDQSFDAVLSSAVLHFARDEREFTEMLTAMWSVLRVGGLFFARLASSIGIEQKVVHLAGRRYSLPDGSERFLVNEDFIENTFGKLNAEWLEPLKTTNVQNLRSMTTIVLRKL